MSAAEHSTWDAEFSLQTSPHRFLLYTAFQIRRLRHREATHSWKGVKLEIKIKNQPRSLSGQTAEHVYPWPSVRTQVPHSTLFWVTQGQLWLDRVPPLHRPTRISLSLGTCCFSLDLTLIDCSLLGAGHPSPCFQTYCCVPVQQLSSLLSSGGF